MDQDPVAFSFFNEIGIINQLVSAKFDQVLPPSMTQAQFTVLNHFVRMGHESRSPAQLASTFQITRSTMSSTLARMERHGLITLSVNPSDGRGRVVRLTKKGRDMRERCVAAVLPLVPLLNSITDAAKLAELLPQLIDLRTALETTRDLDLTVTDNVAP